MAKKKITYTEAIHEIEEIISSIETETPDIDKISDQIKRVSFLIQFCKNKLHETDEEVKKILGEEE